VGVVTNFGCGSVVDVLVEKHDCLPGSAESIGSCKTSGLYFEIGGKKNKKITNKK
jgi:hypothetical protein